MKEQLQLITRRPSNLSGVGEGQEGGNFVRLQMPNGKVDAMTWSNSPVLHCRCRHSWDSPPPRHWCRSLSRSCTCRSHRNWPPAPAARSWWVPWRVPAVAPLLSPAAAAAAPELQHLVAVREVKEDRIRDYPSLLSCSLLYLLDIA